MIEIPSNLEGLWTVQTPDISIEYQRVYPTRVTVDIKWKTPEFRETFDGPDLMSLVRAIQRIRDREIAYMKEVFAAGTEALLPQLPYNGTPIYVSPAHDHKMNVQLRRDWQLDQCELDQCEIVVIQNREIAAIDNEHPPIAHEVFLADQILQAQVRANTRELLNLYDGNLLEEVISKWAKIQRRYVS